MVFISKCFSLFFLSGLGMVVCFLVQTGDGNLRVFTGKK